MTHFLGGDVLYDRLSLATEILGRFVACAPRPVTLAQLAEHTGRMPRDIAPFCTAMQREALLRVADRRIRSWQLACEPSAVTLEDAYRCALALRNRTRRAASSGAAAQRDVDLLLMQASMSVNQSVVRLLRQFTLDRLKVGASGMFAARPVQASTG
ncbi:hypothetical protein E4K72_15500 [Oxalobacteraceae bacterium OM1]|nr:hypothetical protein E4K72_15500 [Oxalobacteraceae bacterium OM1]